MKLTAYYDGACYVCTHEMKKLARKDRGQQIQFVDISDPNFSAQKEGLDPTLVNRKMHVKTADGKVLAGVDGVLELWKQIPSYRPLVTVLKAPIVKPVFKLTYATFARLRMYLPKRKKHQCDCL